MNKEIILLARQAARELKTTRAIKPGLRKRLNELRCKLLRWLSSETRRGPTEPEYKHGPKKRHRVRQEDGSYKYQSVPTLVETGGLLRGRLVRSQLYEGIEALLVAVAEGCAAKPKPSWSPQACADEMLRLCEYLELQLGEPTKDSSGTCIDDAIRHKFLQAWKSKGSQNERADKVAELVTDDEWIQFSKNRPIKKTKRGYFYKLILDCDGKKSPKWLGNLK